MVAYHINIYFWPFLFPLHSCTENGFQSSRSNPEAEGGGGNQEEGFTKRIHSGLRRVFSGGVFQEDPLRRVYCRRLRDHSRVSSQEVPSRKVPGTPRWRDFSPCPTNEHQWSLVGHHPPTANDSFPLLEARASRGWHPISTKQCFFKKKTSLDTFMENSVLYISLYLNIQRNRFEQLYLENVSLVTVREASACQTTTFFNFVPFPFRSFLDQRSFFFSFFFSFRLFFCIKDIYLSSSSSPSFLD